MRNFDVFSLFCEKMNILRSDTGNRLHPVHPTVAASIGEEHVVQGQPAHSSSSIIEDPSSFLNQPGDSAFSNHQHFPVLQRYCRMRALFVPTDFYISVPNSWHFCKDPVRYRYLWLTDPDADADPYQNLKWLLGCKKICFFILVMFLSKNLKALNCKNMFDD